MNTTKIYNEKWPYIPDNPYRMLIIGGSGSGKTYALLNLIKEQDNNNLIDKIYFYSKDLNEPKYQFLINKGEDLRIKHLNDSMYGHLNIHSVSMMFTIILMITTQAEK